MELTINLVHDVVHYNGVDGVLKNDVIGCTHFHLYRSGDYMEIEFLSEGQLHDTVWAYKCYLTDHDTLLHVKF
jgi:hypothetical protein